MNYELKNALLNALYARAIAFTRKQKSLIFLAMDAFWIALTFTVSQALVLGIWPNARLLSLIGIHLLILVPLGVAMIVVTGLHRVRLNAYQMRSAGQTAAVAMALGLIGAVMAILPDSQITPAGCVLFSSSFLILSVGSRQVLRDIVLAVYRHGKTRKRVLIYGAGQTGQQLAAALATDDAVEPVCFVDDNPTLQSLTLSGLTVYAPVQVPDLIVQKRIDRVVIAMPSVSQPVQARIARSLREMGCEVLSLPSFADLIEIGDTARSVPQMQMASLLGRNRLEKELPGVSDTYHGRRILVTGAGGSIGSEICRQLLTCNPQSLVLLDHSELALYAIDKELSDLRSPAPIVPVLGSIGERSLMRHILKQYKIDVVLHAAAYKHVPMVECNMVEGLRNNVIGTRILADEAKRAGVARFTLISSDKAVRPTSAMGCSKRLAELIVQDLATRSPNTVFSMVRFGNVLGSSGSVVPLFQDQIARGGPVTVTHPEVTRYFMTIPEAVRLVLLAGSIAQGGDVLVLDMGAPVAIRDVARRMIEGAGLSVRDQDTPNGDIEITYSGLRPGEKLHEELLISPDMITTPHPKIMRAQESHLSELEMANVMKDLRRIIESRDDKAARALLDRWIEGRSPTGPRLNLSNE